MKKITTTVIILISTIFCHELDYMLNTAILSSTDTPNKGKIRVGYNFEYLSTSLDNTLANHIALDYYGTNASGFEMNYMKNSQSEDNFSSTTLVEFGCYWLWNDIDDVPFRALPFSFHHEGTFSSTRIKTSFGGYTKMVEGGDTKAGAMADISLDLIVAENLILTNNLKVTDVALFNTGLIYSIPKLGSVKVDYLLSANADDSYQWIGLSVGYQLKGFPLGSHSADLKLVPNVHIPIGAEEDMGETRFNLSLVSDFN